VDVVPLIVAASAPPEMSTKTEFPPVAHGLKRKHDLAYGGIRDHAGQLTATVNQRFALEQTIFKTLPPNSPASLFQRSKLDYDFTWDNAAAGEIEKAYSAVPRPVSDDSAIFNFMLTECDFSIEHADGSFLDHLYFCQEYAARHYAKANSTPRVMLLHSIMGVGTNCFPMTLDKVPTLRSLVSAEDMAQIEAFPSILRLLIHGPLLVELVSCDKARLGQLRSIRFHRLLDNGPLTLSAEQLWEQLNYQLIHAIDFLPPASWKRTSGTYFFHIFQQLHELLSRLGQLQATVNWDPDSMQPLAEGAIPSTWRHYLIELLPTTIVLRLASKSMVNYSAQIHHSLEYAIEWDTEKLW